MTLDQIQVFFATLTLSAGGVAFIAERSGLLVGSSRGEVYCLLIN